MIDAAPFGMTSHEAPHRVHVPSGVSPGQKAGAHPFRDGFCRRGTCVEAIRESTNAICAKQANEPRHSPMFGRKRPVTAVISLDHCRQCCYDQQEAVQWVTPVRIFAFVAWRALANSASASRERPPVSASALESPRWVSGVSRAWPKSMTTRHRSRSEAGNGQPATRRHTPCAAIRRGGGP